MKRRRDLWCHIETVNTDGTAGPCCMVHLDRTTANITVSATVAFIAVTDIATGRLLAAISPLPAHPCQTTSRHRIQLDNQETE